MRAVIFANGEVGDTEFARSQLEPNDLIVAVDGGLVYAISAGVTPAIIVGDLDSAPSELVQIAERRGAEILRHPVRKDQTDLELALDLPQIESADEIVVLGALGGRLDHALANILLLARDYNGTKPPIRLLAPGYELCVAGHRLTLIGSPGDLVTLIPISAQVTDISTDDLEYPLRGESLARGSSRGVSNVMTLSEATISRGEGILLVVHVSGAEASDPPPDDGDGSM